MPRHVRQEKEALQAGETRQEEVTAHGLFAYYSLALLVTNVRCLFAPHRRRKKSVGEGHSRFFTPTSE
jgi:hypothetical protein